MALIVKDRVKESTTTTGTSNFTLLGAASGFQTFAVIGNTNTTYYAAVDQATGDWEVGIGTYSSTGPTLTRDTVLESSNSGSKVVFAAGSKEVFCTYPAERSVYLDAAGSAVTTLDIGTLGVTTANISTANITAGTVTTTPSSGNDLVNKTYVDTAVSSGIHFHQPVRVESPINLNATYNNGTAGVGATLTNAGTQVALVIDGVTVATNDRVLIYQQTTQTQNGIYVVTNTGSGSTNWVLTRSADANTYAAASATALGEGSAVFVQQGTTGAGETYVCNTPGTITFGTTNITFAQISSAQIYSAGTGLTLTGTQFSITNTGTAGTYGSASSVPVFVTNAQGQVTSVTPTAIAITSAAVSGLAASATTDTTNAANITSGTLPSARLNGSYTGITGVGTLTAGTWNASTIAATRGGTGLTSFVQGDLLYATSTTTIGSLADVVAGNALISGGVGGDPAWGKIGLTTHVSGTLPVGNGGTGATTLTGYVYGNGTGAFTASTSIPNSATTATNLNTANAIVARDASGNFTAGTITAALNGNASTATTAANVNNGTLTLAVSGTGLSGSATFTANQSGNSTFTVASNATNLNTVSTIVARDGSGNFSAGTITAALSGNATTATTLQTARNIGGVSFNGSADINLPGVNTAGNQNTTGNAATATTATNQSGGTVSATTLSASGVATFSAGSAAAPAITTSGDTNTGIFFPAADTIAFAEGGAESMRIDSSGNLGIGTSSPSARLEVTDTSAAAATALVQLTGQNSYELNIQSVTSTNSTVGARYNFAINSSNGEFSWSNSGGERARITSDGNLLLNTTSGTAKLEVAANGVMARFKTGSASDGRVEWAYNTTDIGYIGADTSTEFSVFARSGNVLKLGANGSERARIDTAGRLLLNTTSARNISSNLTAINVLTEGTGLNASSMGAYLDSTSAGSSPQFIFGRSRGTVVGAVTSVANGDLLGQLTFTGADGTSGGITAATITAAVDGTPGTNDMPGRLVFSTTADGASSPTERMRLDASGNLGLGATPRAWDANYKVLEFGRGVFGNSTSGASSFWANNAFHDGSNWIYKSTALATIYFQASGQHQWYNAPSGTSGNAITFTQALTLNASGQLETGIAGSASAPSFTRTGDTNTGIFFPAADTIAFAEGGVEAMRIDSAGNVGIGKTSPSARLDVAGGISGTVLRSSNGITVNSATISANYTIAAGDNGMSAGPVTVNSGITVTVSSGSRWVVI